MIIRARILWGLGLIVAMLTAAIGYLASTPLPDETPEASRFGYIPEARRTQDAEEFIASCPSFVLTDEAGRPVVQDNRRANVRLWDLRRKAARTLAPHGPQEIGDCTSWGGKCAIESTQAGQIEAGQSLQYRPVYPPFLYGVARVKILRGSVGRGDGATGQSVAQAAREYGVLPADDPRCKPYAGSIARDWGRNGPPAWAYEEAAQHKVKTVALVRTPDEAMDAICNGYGVTIASSWGSERMAPEDGRIVARRSTTWYHQMCIDGYDGSTGKRWWHVQNSWGADAHPAPIDGSPPGGFWVGEDDLKFILSNNGDPDSWAFSDFDGFPARALQFSFVSTSKPVRAAKAAGRTQKRELAL